MTTPTQAQIEAVLAEFEDELTAKQRSLIADQIYRITAAAQVGERPLNVLTGFQGEMLDAERKRVAAQEIETISEVIAKYRKKEIDATIECCAQVAADYDSDCVDSREIAAAIRKLKDEHIDPNLIYPGKDPDFTFPEEKE